MKRKLVTLLLIFCLLAQFPLLYAQSKTAWYCQPCGSDCDKETYTAAGKCPHCGMALYEEDQEVHRKALEAKRFKVLFYLQDGVEVLDFAGPMEVFSYAGFDVATVSKTKAPIQSQGILTILPDFSITDAPKADILAFFGGNAGRASGDSLVIRWVREQPVPAYYFSVCTGAFILGKAGVLDQLTATTFHESIESLQKAQPKTKVLAGVRFVDNGKVITTAGISAGIDGALHLVAKIRGEAVAKSIAAYMEYDRWTPGQGLVIKAAKP